jgi:hypothetical protein
MLKLCDDLGFTLEPQPELGIRVEEFLRQDFYSNLALEAWVISPVDSRHTAAP